jgi:hypothetical protein
MATTNGLLYNLAPQVSFSALYRYFQPDYQAYYSNAFGETGKTYNENGLYLGTEIHPYKGFKISAYFDSYSFMWLRSSVFAPSHGNEYFVQLDYITNRKLSMYVKFKFEEKQENFSSEIDKVRQVVALERWQIRYHLVFSPEKQISFKTRFEISAYSKAFEENKHGFLLYQDVNYAFINFPLKLNCRYAIFNTTDFDDRIYAYENDILYGFSIPAYYSKGSRFYINLKYSFSEKIDFWFKYAQTFYNNVESMGSGKDEIFSDTKSQLKFQLRIKF